MFIVQRRDAATLLPIILNNVNKNTEIVSDEWKAYNKLSENGYKHYTVNHSKNYVDPTSGKHTQLIECLWGVAKNKIMRAMKGNSQENLKGHLAEQWFRSINSKSSDILFEKTLNLLKQN